MTKKCGARLCIPNLARHFIRHSAVPSLTAVLLRKVPIVLFKTVLTFFLFRCATEEGCDELQIASSPDYEQNKHVFSGPTGRWIDVEIPGQ